MNQLLTRMTHDGKGIRLILVSMILLILLSLISFWGCSKKTVDPTPQPPNIIEISVSPNGGLFFYRVQKNDTISVTGDDTLILKANASDPDGDKLAYKWSATDGQSNKGQFNRTDSSQVKWTAPNDSILIRMIIDVSGGQEHVIDTFYTQVTSHCPTLTRSATADPTGGCAPLAVQFTGSASGGCPSYTWSWTFGDGGTGNQQNPSHTYNSPGTYTATMTVTDSKGTSCQKNATITVTGGTLTCTATADPTNGCAPLNVCLTGIASGGCSPYSYSWNFGDGGTGNQQNPSHTYISAGTYTATMTVTDSKGTSCQKNATITVTGGTLTCTATADPTSGCAPLNVCLTGIASGGCSPYSYSWNFGDGGSSSQQNPCHTYNSPGTYTATMTVTDSKGTTCQKTVTITVTGGTLTCTSTADPTSGCAPLPVQFTGSASGGCPSYTWSWTFGDGGTSSQQNPSHTYNSPGTYTATMTVTDSKGTTCQKTVTITVTGGTLTCTSTADPTSGCAPLPVQFTGSASGGCPSYTWSWTFGDGGTSSQQNPSHTYNSPGTYTATMTVTDSKGASCQKTVTISIITTPDKPTHYSPASGTVDMTQPVDIDWSDVSGGTSYQIQIDNDPNFSSPVIDEETTDSYYSASALENCTIYYWRVRAYNSCGWGSWTTPWWFQTVIVLPDIPTPYSPASGTVDMTQPVDIDWSDVSGATRYQIQIDNDPNFSSPVIDTTTADSYYSASGLESGTFYYWRVRAYNDCGWGSWPTPWWFQTMY